MKHKAGYSSDSSTDEIKSLEQIVDWEILEVASYMIKIKLNFQRPEKVTQIQDAPDKISIELNLESFVDPYQMSIVNGTTVEKYLPAQLDNENHIKILDTISMTTVYVLLSVLFISYLGLYFSKSSLVLVWILFNSVQLIAHLPLINVIMPANVSYFNS